MEIFNPQKLDRFEKNKFVINWLIKRFGLSYEYQHSFKDQWLLVHIWVGQLSIRIDTRVEEQIDLFNRIPYGYKGTVQHGTGKRVNLFTLYFDLNQEFDIPYPTIIETKLIKKYWCVGGRKQMDSDDFLIYQYHLHLSDDTILEVESQKKNEPIEMEYTYPTHIQTRFFYNHIENI